MLFLFGLFRADSGLDFVSSLPRRAAGDNPFGPHPTRGMDELGPDTEENRKVLQELIHQYAEAGKPLHLPAVLEVLKK
jgi:hypothetical protein